MHWSRGPDVVRWTEGHLAASQRPWRRRPRRGRSAWHACGWGSRELGRPRRLHLKDRRGAGTDSPKPEAVDVAPGVRRSEPQVLGWYRRVKATKRGGMGGEESERLILPVKRGNHAHDTPWREGATVGGKDGQHTEVGARLHVTTTDSRTGQTSLRDSMGHLHRILDQRVRDGA